MNRKESENLVRKTYLEVLGREPEDPKHFRTWVSMVELGVFDAETLPAVFELSAEYRLKTPA